MTEKTGSRIEGLPDMPPLPYVSRDAQPAVRTYGLACYEAGSAAAVQAAKQVPAGFVLVPREPTEEMWTAGRDPIHYRELGFKVPKCMAAPAWRHNPDGTLELDTSKGTTAVHVWRAMIVAAPSATSLAEAAEAGQVEALLHLWGAFRTTEVHGDPVASKQRFRMIFTFPTLEALHAADDKWMHLTGSDSQRCTSLNAGLSTVAGEAIATTPMAAEANEPDWRHPKLQAMLSQEARKHIEARLICEVLDASTVEELEDVYSNDYETELFSRVKELKHSALAATPTSPQAPAPQAVVGEASERDWELTCDECAGTGKVDVSEALHVDGRYMGDQLLRETCNACAGYGFTICLADIPKEIQQ